MRTAAAVGGELGTAATVLGRLHRSAARGVARRDGCFDGSVKGESVSEWRGAYPCSFSILAGSRVGVEPARAV